MIINGFANNDIVRTSLELMHNIFSDVLVTMLCILLDSLITASSVTMKDMSLNRVSRYSRDIPVWWAFRGLNPGPDDYESTALTN